MINGVSQRSLSQSARQQSKANLAVKNNSKVVVPSGELTNPLSYEECKKLSDDYLLPIKVIYELYAEYNSLLNMSKDKQVQQDKFEEPDDEDDEDEEENKDNKKQGLPLG